MCIWQHVGINNQFYSIPRMHFCGVYLFNLRSYNAVVFKSHFSNKIFITFGIFITIQNYKICENVLYILVCKEKALLWAGNIYRENCVNTRALFPVK